MRFFLRYMEKKNYARLFLSRYSAVFFLLMEDIRPTKRRCIREREVERFPPDDTKWSILDDDGHPMLTFNGAPLGHPNPPEACTELIMDRTLSLVVPTSFWSAISKNTTLRRLTIRPGPLSYPDASILVMPEEYASRTEFLRHLVECCKHISELELSGSVDTTLSYFYGQPITKLVVTEFQDTMKTNKFDKLQEISIEFSSVYKRRDLHLGRLVDGNPTLRVLSLDFGRISNNKRGCVGSEPLDGLFRALKKSNVEKLRVVGGEIDYDYDCGFYLADFVSRSIVTDLTLEKVCMAREEHFVDFLLAVHRNKSLKSICLKDLHVIWDADTIQLLQDDPERCKDAPFEGSFVYMPTDEQSLPDDFKKCDDALFEEYYFDILKYNDSLLEATLMHDGRDCGREFGLFTWLNGLRADPYCELSRFHPQCFPKGVLETTVLCMRMVDMPSDVYHIVLVFMAIVGKKKIPLRDFLQNFR